MESTTTREISIDRLVIDPDFASLYIEDPAVIDRIERSMRTDGFDPHRPPDVWKDGAGRGRHIVMEGHMRIIAAKRAGLTSVRVAFRHPADRDAALLWAAEQQTNRRNASREALCLSILRALQRNGTLDGTRAQLAERFGFGDATVGRALQVLKRGTESEILAVLEGTHSLKTAYKLIQNRERAENERDPEPAQRAADPEPDVEPEEPEPLPGPVSRELAALRDALGQIHEAVDQAQDLFESDPRHITGATDEHRTALVNDVVEAVDAMTDAYATFRDARVEA